MVTLNQQQIRQIATKLHHIEDQIAEVRSRVEPGQGSWQTEVGLIDADEWLESVEDGVEGLTNLLAQMFGPAWKK